MVSIFAVFEKRQLLGLHRIGGPEVVVLVLVRFDQRDEHVALVRLRLDGGRDRAARLAARAVEEPFRTMSPRLSRLLVMATALSAYLYRVTGNREVLLGLPFANRPPQFARTCGLLMEQTLLRVEVAEGEAPAEGEPAVVRELLRNPLLTEALAVRIASRRPVRPETLRCIHEERRWRTRAAVRRALARNPYVEPAIALALLPALQLRDLDAIAADGSLHAEVRAQARRVAARRRRRGREG